MISDLFRFNKHRTRPSIPILLSILFSYSTTFTYAQTDKLVAGLPQENQGFLILNNDEVEAEYFVVEIVNKKYDAQSVLNENILKRYELWHQNYVWIDAEFWNLNRIGEMNYITIKAFNSNHELLGNEWSPLDLDYPPIGEPELYKGCSWSCVGSNYSYEIQQFRRYDNPDLGHYSLMPTHNYVDEETGTTIPYYRYFDFAEVSSYTNDFTWIVQSGGLVWDPNCLCFVPSSTLEMVPHFHGLSDWSYGDLGNPTSMAQSGNGMKFIRFDQYPNTSGTIYQSASGSGITTPQVFAMNKYTAWWRQHPLQYPMDPSENPTNISNDCINDLSWAINKLNSEGSSLEHNQDINNYMPPAYSSTHPYSYPSLTCDGNTGGGIDDDYNFNDCGYGQNYFENLWQVTENGSGWWFAEVLELFTGCFNELGMPSQGETGNGGTTVGSTSAAAILANVQYISLAQRDGIGYIPIFNYSHSDLIGNNGNPQSLSGPTVEKGLYELAFKLPGQVPTKVVFENKHTLSTNIPLSTYFSATVFPVPIVSENAYSIHAHTTARLRVLYELRDSFGALLFTQNVLLPQGHDAVHNITTTNPLPYGLLIHRFIFEDGSILSIPTIKAQN